MATTEAMRLFVKILEVCANTTFILLYILLLSCRIFLFFSPFSLQLNRKKIRVGIQGHLTF